MDVRLQSVLKHLPNLKSKRYFIDDQVPAKRRQRIFDGKLFFLSILELVRSTNCDGADSALANVFMLANDIRPPTRSALCQFRAKITFKFFKDVFDRAVAENSKNSPLWNGMKLIAIDGQQLTLPRTKDVIANGFTGRSTSKHRESYMPKGFLTAAINVLSGTIERFTFNPTLNENKDAYHLVEQFKGTCVFLFDRLYYSQKLLDRLFELNQYFVIRCKRNSSKKIGDFFESKLKETKIKVGNKMIKLVKVKHPGTKEFAVYATNLPARYVTKKTIDALYKLRWEVELFFRKVTSDTKGEQWHSKSYNGILQELYCRMWAINFTRNLMCQVGETSLKVAQMTYKKANFKLCFGVVCRYLICLKSKLTYLIGYIRLLVKLSTQTRKRYSRSYPRHIRKPASIHIYNNTEWFWDKNYSLN